MSNDELESLSDALESSGIRVYHSDLRSLRDLLLVQGWSFEYREPCQYTHSHTQAWCGHPGCRES